MLFEHQKVDTGKRGKKTNKKRNCISTIYINMLSNNKIVVEITFIIGS
jgi:hypothetical protein